MRSDRAAGEASGRRANCRGRGVSDVDRVETPLRLSADAAYRSDGRGRTSRCDSDGDDRAGGQLRYDHRRDWFVRPPTAKGRLKCSIAGQSVAIPVKVSGFAATVRSQFRPRRDAGDVKNGLQRGHVSRVGQGQERLQALAPRLRSGVRSPRADRRHRVAGGSIAPRPIRA